MRTQLYATAPCWNVKHPLKWCILVILTSQCLSKPFKHLLLPPPTLNSRVRTTFLRVRTARRLLCTPHPLRVPASTTRPHGDLFQTIDAKCVPAIATDRVLWLSQTIVECGIAVCEARHTAFAGRLAAAVVRTRARQRAYASLAHTIHRRPLRSHT